MVMLRVCRNIEVISLCWLQGHKVYVQQRLREAGLQVWRMLQQGAHVYVCGDAGSMAAAVEAALLDIISQHGVRPFLPASAAGCHTLHMTAIFGQTLIFGFLSVHKSKRCMQLLLVFASVQK